MIRLWPNLCFFVLIGSTCLLLSSCQTVEKSAAANQSPAQEAALIEQASKRVSQIVFVAKGRSDSSSQIFYTALDPQPFPETERQKLIKIIHSDADWRKFKPGSGMASMALQRFVLTDKHGKALCVCTQTTENSTIQVRPIARQKSGRFFPGSSDSYRHIRSEAFTRELVRQMDRNQSVKLAKLRSSYRKLGADFDATLY